MSKANGATEINEFLEAEIGRNIHELKRTDLASPHQENATGENLPDDLGILLRRITERSTCEIENLIDELHRLRVKLETDGDLIERAIARHSELSQGAMHRRQCEKTSASNHVILCTATAWLSLACLRCSPLRLPLWPPQKCCSKRIGAAGP